MRGRNQLSTFHPDPNYLALAEIVEVAAHAIRAGEVHEPYTDVVRRLMIAAAKMVAQTPDDRENYDDTRTPG